MMCDHESDAADKARAAEKQRENRVRLGETKVNTIFDKYDSDFYKSRSQDFVDYARPQLDRDYAKGMMALKAALARQGLSDSSVSQEKDRFARTAFGEELQNVQQKGEGYSNQSRDSVETARQNLLSQNLALANPTAAASAAQARIHTLSALPQYQPLVDTFGHLTEGLATQAALERRGKAQYNAFGLGPQNSSTRVIK